MDEDNQFYISSFPLSTVEPKPVDYIWKGRLARGMAAIWDGDPATGKALSLDTPLPTPTGWTTMGQVAVGDLLLDEQGEMCRVVFATEVMLNHRCYAVTFSDGTEIVADADHVWSVRDRLARQREAKRRWKRTQRTTDKRNKHPRPDKKDDGAFLLTTEQMIERIRLSDGRANYSVDNAKPLVLPEVGLPIAPYTFGVWLGDGTSSAGSVTKPDVEVWEGIAQDGYKFADGSGCDTRTIYGIVPYLRAMGVMGKGNKHIPDQYLRASYEQRLALLHGLVDTDGYVGDDGNVEFTTTTLRLADGFMELLSSMGIRFGYCEGRAVLNGKDCGPKYRITFRANFAPCRLPRKLGRWRPASRPGGECRYITNIEEVASVPVRCIQVDSPSHLFLCGETMIPTHNTSAAMDIAARITTGEPMPGEVERRQPKGVLLLTAEDSLEQTIRPRMEAAGADLARVGIVVKRQSEGTAHSLPVIPDDIDGIRTQAEAFDADLILIDPIMGYISGSLDSNNDQNIRAAMAPLISMIADLNCGLLVIRHLNKSTGSSPMYRGGGSIGMSGIVRFGMSVARDPNDPTGQTRVIAPYKVNVGKEPRSITYQLVSAEGYDVARVEWGEECDITPSELLMAAKPEADQARMRDCIQWLEQEMEGHYLKQPLQKEVKSHTSRDGWTWEEVKEAMKVLNIGTWRQDSTEDMVLIYRDKIKKTGSPLIDDDWIE